MNNRTQCYALIGHDPVPCKDIQEWAKKMVGVDRTVARDVLSDELLVSTVFLGIDHNFGRGEPILFETMIFGGPLDQKMWRYETWDEAEAGHARAVVLARGLDLTKVKGNDDGITNNEIGDGSK